jgi:hypothetical protein
LLTVTEGISVDEIQNVYSDGFGIKKSQQIRKEKAEMTQRFRDEEANMGEIPGKVEMSTSSTPIEGVVDQSHVEKREKTAELV